MTVNTSTKTIKQVLQDGTRFLAAKGKENARLEAEKLIAFGLKKERVDIYLSLDKPLTENELDLLRRLFKERAGGKPLQYITGEVHFRYLRLMVNEHAFIPRPETELIVDLALSSLGYSGPSYIGHPESVRQAQDKLREGSLSLSSSVLELGTGSGAIALAIAQEGKIPVTAVDISEKVLEVAKENTEANNVCGVTWLKSNWFENVRDKFDLIVCNPPYVSLKEYNGLPAEIREHEPATAVTDNGDGLQCLEKIISDAPNYLNDKGSLLLEIGFEQKESVNNLLEKSGFKKINFEKDLAGKTRFCIATK